MFFKLKKRNTYRRLGDQYRNAGEWSLAAGAYRRHLARRASDLAIWVQLGHVEKEQGRLEAAEKAYRHAASLDPGNADPLLHLAYLLKQQDRIGEALLAFQRVERIGPSAEVAAMLQHLGRMRHHDAMKVTGAGAMLLVIDDYLESIGSSPGRIESSLLSAAIAADDLESHFIVGDGGTRSGDPRFLALDRDAVVAIVRASASAAAALGGLIVDARADATPIMPGPGSLIVIVGRPEAPGNAVHRFLAPCSRGARLVAYIGDPALPAIEPRHRQEEDRALAELIGSADVIVAGSDLYLKRLVDLATAVEAESAAIVTVGPVSPHAPSTGAVSDVLAAFRGQGHRSTVVDGAGPALLATLRQAERNHPVRRRLETVALPPNLCFRPADPTSGAIPAADARRMIFGRGFTLIDTAAWISGTTGEIAFRADVEQGDAVVILVALAIMPSAVGSRFSISFADAPDHHRRWCILAGTDEFVRLEGRISFSGICVLRLQRWSEDETIVGQTTYEDRTVADMPAVGVTAIGYYQAGNVSSSRDLREQLLFVGRVAAQHVGTTTVL